jgi:hypothetical protein
LADVGDGVGVAARRGLGMAPDPSCLKDPLVLANFSATAIGRAGFPGFQGPGAQAPAPADMKANIAALFAAAAGNGNGGGRVRGLGQAGATGPAAPAIVVGKRGNGTVLLCGPSVGMVTSLLGTNCDDLILAMLKVLTDGRVVPQLEPEGPHLGRKESLRSMGHAETAEDNAPPPVPDRPDGNGTRTKLPDGVKQLAADQADEFNINGKVPATPGELMLSFWNRFNYVKVGIGPDGLKVSLIDNGFTKDLDQGTAPLLPGAPFAVKMRNDHLFVEAGAVMAEASLMGIHKGGTGAKDFVGDLSYRAVEGVYFSDDFMRTSNFDGGWKTIGGKWTTVAVENPDMGANPFSYKVDATNEVATALQGTKGWDEYKFASAVQPRGNSGTIGLGWYAQDENNMYLFQAAVLTNQTPKPDGFQLLKLVAGQPTTVIDSKPGGLTTMQWYRAQVKTLGANIGVFVDGVKVLGGKDTTYRSGKIALRADHTLSRFNDVLVESVAVDATRGQALSGKVPEYAGIIDVDSWAGPATAWEPSPDTGGLFWRRNEFFGDISLRYDASSLGDGDSVSMVLDGDGQSADTGYQLTATRNGGNLDVIMTHSDHGTPVTSAASTSADGKLSLAITREGKQVSGVVNGETMVGAMVHGASGGGRLAFRTVGFKPKISSFSVWSMNLKDYTFDAAPTDWWVSDGAWDQTNRWACTPDWSWFGGVNETGKATVWNKQQFSGDITLDFYAGPKMLSTKEGFSQNKDQFENMNCVLCGDGKDATSGYSFVACPPGGGAAIYKNGAMVASVRDFRFFTRGHNRWANIRAEKQGSRIELFVDGQSVVRYDDPQPLSGGYAGIWTQNNGIMIPRVTLAYEKLGAGLLSMPSAR